MKTARFTLRRAGFSALVIGALPALVSAGPQAARPNQKSALVLAVGSLPDEFHSVVSCYLIGGDEETLWAMAKMADAYAREQHLPRENGDYLDTDFYALLRNQGVDSSQLPERLVETELALQPVLKADPLTSGRRFAELRRSFNTGEIEQRLRQAFGDRNYRRSPLDEALNQAGSSAVDISKLLGLNRSSPSLGVSPTSDQPVPEQLYHHIAGIRTPSTKVANARKNFLDFVLTAWDRSSESDRAKKDLLYLFLRLTRLAEAFEGPISPAHSAALKRAADLISQQWTAKNPSDTENWQAQAISQRLTKALNRE